MGILSVNPTLPSTEVGFVGVKPSIRRIFTDDILATVTAPGYLNSYQSSYQFETYEMALVYTTDQGDIWANIAITDDIISLVPDAGNGNVVGIPVTIDDIATFANTDGALKDGSVVARAIGFVQSGTSDSEGGFIAFSGEPSSGAVIYGALANNLDTTVRVLNDFHSDSTSVRIPESGVGLSRFILSDSLTTQYLNTGNFTISEGDLTVTAGDIFVGNQTVLSSSATGVGDAAALVSADITVTSVDLAAAGTVDIVPIAGYIIRVLQLNKAGTNFSGGGGNRNIQISDGTTVYTVIPAATAQSLTNAVWGATALPLPTVDSINTETVAALQVSYSGGTTDYTFGSLTISLLLEKVT